MAQPSRANTLTPARLREFARQWYEVVLKRATLSVKTAQYQEQYQAYLLQWPYEALRLVLNGLAGDERPVAQRRVRDVLWLLRHGRFERLKPALGGLVPALLKRAEAEWHAYLSLLHNDTPGRQVWEEVCRNTPGAHEEWLHTLRMGDVATERCPRWLWYVRGKAEWRPRFALLANADSLAPPFVPRYSEEARRLVVEHEHLMQQTVAQLDWAWRVYHECVARANTAMREQAADYWVLPQMTPGVLRDPTVPEALVACFPTDFESLTEEYHAWRNEFERSLLAAARVGKKSDVAELCKRATEGLPAFKDAAARREEETPNGIDGVYIAGALELVQRMFVREYYVRMLKAAAHLREHCGLLRQLCVSDADAQKMDNRTREVTEFYNNVVARHGQLNETVRTLTEYTLPERIARAEEGLNRWLKAQRELKYVTALSRIKVARMNVPNKVENALEQGRASCRFKPDDYTHFMQVLEDTFTAENVVVPGFQKEYENYRQTFMALAQMPAVHGYKHARERPAWAVSVLVPRLGRVSQRAHESWCEAWRSLEVPDDAWEKVGISADALDAVRGDGAYEDALVQGPQPYPFYVEALPYMLLSAHVIHTI